MGGFEPTDNRVKVCCLTTWRHPNLNIFSIIYIVKMSSSGSSSDSISAAIYSRVPSSSPRTIQ